MSGREDGLAAALERADDGCEHTATWWREQARAAGIDADYEEVGEALAAIGREPFDLRHANLYKMGDAPTAMRKGRY